MYGSEGKGRLLGTLCCWDSVSEIAGLDLAIGLSGLGRES